jgi:hypothetical protein
VQCAWAAIKKKDSYLQAQFFRIRARRGDRKAILAVAASMLTAIYHMLKDLGRAWSSAWPNSATPQSSRLSPPELCR